MNGKTLFLGILIIGGLPPICLGAITLEPTIENVILTEVTGRLEFSVKNHLEDPWVGTSRFYIPRNTHSLFILDHGNDMFTENWIGQFQEMGTMDRLLVKINQYDYPVIGHLGIEFFTYNRDYVLWNVPQPNIPEPPTFSLITCVFVFFLIFNGAFSGKRRA